VTSKITERPAATQPEREARALLTATAVRDAANRMLDLALARSLEYWQVDLDRLPATADFVVRVARDRFPTLDVPMHSRWRHFVFSGRDLWREIAGSRIAPDREVRARAEIDLAITSVLLDAGAGGAWKYRDAATGIVAERSEGLALASLRWFASGAFSGSPADSLRADAAALRQVDAGALNTAFQVSPDNPLAGSAQRASLLNRLGMAAETRPDLFAIAGVPRLGGLFDAFSRRASGHALPATAILETLLDALGPIWEARPSLAGVPLGDCWPHPALGHASEAKGYVPLHKLSQWLTYSLLEPLQNAGIDISGVNELTGLPEYRNGGLLVDTGVLVPHDAQSLLTTHPVSHPFVVELRALTVALLDRLVPLVAERLGLTNDMYMAARVLEGGTWAAGRRIARDNRADGGPPFHISSDGTVL
jgi:hypothetical protein